MIYLLDTNACIVDFNLRLGRHRLSLNKKSEIATGEVND